MELPILVRGHYKDTVARYDKETLFIIIERYVKLYIFDRVERSHFIEIISHLFSILSSLESGTILCRGSIGLNQ